MRQQACTFRYKRSSGVSSRDYHERLARIKVSRAQMELDRVHIGAESQLRTASFARLGSCLIDS